MISSVVFIIRIPGQYRLDGALHLLYSVLLPRQTILINHALQWLSCNRRFFISLSIFLIPLPEILRNRCITFVVTFIILLQLILRFLHLQRLVRKDLNGTLFKVLQGWCLRRCDSVDGGEGMLRAIYRASCFNCRLVHMKTIPFWTKGVIVGTSLNYVLQLLLRGEDTIALLQVVGHLTAKAHTLPSYQILLIMPLLILRCHWRLRPAIDTWHSLHMHNVSLMNA